MPPSKEKPTTSRYVILRYSSLTSPFAGEHCITTEENWLDETTPLEVKFLSQLAFDLAAKGTACRRNSCKLIKTLDIKE